MKKDFNKWFSTFRESIASFNYYIDFNKVVENANKYKIELNIMNSLIGSKNIDKDFINLVEEYSNVLKCIPILLAVREKEIFVLDGHTEYKFNFENKNYTIDEYAKFMKETGLFEMLSNHIVNNLYDYVLGVETGLDSNGRKNRGGHLMENLVESYIKSAGFVKDVNYFKEMNISDMEKRWDIDLSNISNDGKMEKRFDFVIKNKFLYGIETNFYSSSGSKLNETARSYKQIAIESKNIGNFKFVWFTDGKGWNNAKNNLQETFDVLDDIYNIKDMEDGIMSKIFI